jgi:hypothetical protein
MVYQICSSVGQAEPVVLSICGLFLVAGVADGLEHLFFRWKLHRRDKKAGMDCCHCDVTDCVVLI